MMAAGDEYRARCQRQHPRPASGDTGACRRGLEWGHHRKDLL